MDCRGAGLEPSGKGTHEVNSHTSTVAGAPSHDALSCARIPSPFSPQKRSGTNPAVRATNTDLSLVTSPSFCPSICLSPSHPSLPTAGCGHKSCPTSSVKQLEHRSTQEYLSHLSRPQFQTARAFDHRTVSERIVSIRPLRHRQRPRLTHVLAVVRGALQHRVRRRLTC